VRSHCVIKWAGRIISGDNRHYGIPARPATEPSNNLDYRNQTTLQTVQISCIHLFNSRTRMNYSHKYSPYRAVNTLRLGYKNQPVNAV